MPRSDVAGMLQALCKRRHPFDWLQRILRRDQPPNLIEVEVSEGQEADMHMAAMGWVERAAQQPDAAMPTGAF